MTMVAASNRNADAWGTCARRRLHCSQTLTMLLGYVASLAFVSDCQGGRRICSRIGSRHSDSAKVAEWDGTATLADDFGLTNCQRSLAEAAAGLLGDRTIYSHG